ncbi:MAG: IS21 family transposase [Lentisphaerales bacterium]|nr:IS21 family transposase [Lentisphaerales bacterium]
MPKVIEVTTQETIGYLSAQGWSIRKISRELELHRGTVRKYLKCTSDSNTGSVKCTSDSNTGSANKRNGPTSRCSEYHDFIKKSFEQGLSAQRIWQDLVDQYNFSNGYQSVSRYVRHLKSKGELPFRVLHSLPGEEAQIDFGQGAWVIDENGKRKRPHLFRIILSYSRKAYSEVVWQQSTESYIRAIENSFRYFGGVPQILIPDNLKAAVIKADAYDPELNPKLRSFAKHYNCTVLPAKVRRPEHKGKVESAVKYCQDNALKGKSFDSLAQQNEYLRNWEHKVADTRIHGTTQIQVRKAFENVEKEKLQTLPPTLFPCFEEGERIVQRNGHVEILKSFYSVPPEYLRKTVWVRFNNRMVRIFNSKMEQIAVHPRMIKGQYSTQKLHIPEKKISMGEHGSGYLIRQLAKIGDACAIWGEITLQNRGIEAIRVMQGLVQLQKKYTKEQLNKAAVEAVRSECYYLKDFKDLIDLDSVQPELDLNEVHPLMRKMSSYEALTPLVFEKLEDVK